MRWVALLVVILLLAAACMLPAEDWWQTEIAAMGLGEFGEITFFIKTKAPLSGKALSHCVARVTAAREKEVVALYDSSAIYAPPSDSVEGIAHLYVSGPTLLLQYKPLPRSGYGPDDVKDLFEKIQRVDIQQK